VNSVTIPKNITREHILKAMQKIDQEGVPETRKSTQFNIMSEKLYPPKYTISLANQFANGYELPPSEFSGGVESNKFLTDLGFRIVNNETSMNASNSRTYQPARYEMVIKENSSWTKLNKSKMIARKKVDWSTFHDGSTIPLEFHEDFETANNHKHLNRGEKHKVTLMFDVHQYEATLVNVNRKVKSDTLQLLYGKDLKDLLKTVFKSSYDYIKQNRKEGEKKSIVVPDELAEYIEFYETGEPFVYQMKFIPHGHEEGNDMTSLSFGDLTDHIYQYIQSKGFHYQKEEVINLCLSLKTKPFVILSGVSGTGKTKMVQWFAESVGATEENGQFTLIPIRPDWNDGSDLLGYVDIKGEFKKGPLTKVIEHANRNPDLPYFVLLDEMNLARVEYYFSDILSVMESRKWKDGEMVSSNLLTEETSGVDLKLPNNLYIIGTVNMDETTHPFSKKVLDRANTIEFNRVELGNFAFLHNLDEVAPVVVGHDSFASHYLHLKDVYQKHPKLVEDVTGELVKINEALQVLNAHVGYRVRDEICFYIAYNNEGQLMPFDQAMDHCILQKVLPRIAGSDSRVDTLLRKLYLLFTNKQFEDDSESVVELDLTTAKYPQSAAKVVEMLRRLDDGFTSFWIS
jgi:hypothetical protein